MFKVLDLYIAKKFFGTLFFILIMLGIVSVIFDVAEKLEDFSRNNAPFLEIVTDYYLNFVPTILNIVSPLIIFISALYFTSRLANNTEFVVMLSGGISYYRLLVPYLAVGLILAVADYGLKNYVIPLAYEKQLNFEFKYVQLGYNYRGTNTHRQIDKNTYFYAHLYDYNGNIAYKFALEKFEEGRLVYKLRASEAVYDTVTKHWKARNYTLRTIDGIQETLVIGDTLSLKLNISREDFGRKVTSIPATTTPELHKLVEQQKLSGEGLTTFYEVEILRRIALPFSILILIVIAVSLATRKVRGGIGMHLALGIAIAISYELMMRFSTTFATNSDLSPFLAVWLPNIVYSMLAIYFLKTTPK